ncbi:unnamed protein product [Rhodiola kirilowii]
MSIGLSRLNTVGIEASDISDSESSLLLRNLRSCGDGDDFGLLFEFVSCGGF